MVIIFFPVSLISLEDDEDQQEAKAILHMI